MRKYTATHEWVTLDSDGAIATVGITDEAVRLLTDLIYLNLPDVGRVVTAGAPFGEVESVKAVSDIIAPVSGTVVDVNAPVADDLEQLAADPFGTGWLIKVKLSAPLPATLLDVQPLHAE